MLIRTLQRIRYSMTTEPLRWRQKNQMLELLVYNMNTEGRTIYLLDSEITFPELKERQLFKDFDFKLPKQVKENTPVMTVLAKQQQPVEIPYTLHGQEYILKNRYAYFILYFRELDQQCIIRTLLSPSSIYNHLEEIASISDHRNIVTSYYLKLQTQAFLQNSKVNLKQKFTPEMKQQVINYLGNINQNSSQFKISQLMEVQEAAALKIYQTKAKIQNLEEKADKLLRVYRAGAIALTAAHLGVFGYMIFGVEWLGWDITEPLTFSVGALYTLMGLRFYRKFQKDRTQQSVQQALRHWALKPSSRIELNQLKIRLSEEQAELKQIGQKIKLHRNRIIPISTIPDDL